MTLHRSRKIYLILIVLQDGEYARVKERMEEFEKEKSMIRFSFFFF